MIRAAAFFCIVSLAGCAYIGPPKPPALDIPTRITDLRAAEYGDKIVVQFTIGTLTTDGLALKSVKTVELRVAAGNSPQMLPVPAKSPGPVDHDFPAKDWVGKQVDADGAGDGSQGEGVGLVEPGDAGGGRATGDSLRLQGHAGSERCAVNVVGFVW